MQGPTNLENLSEAQKKNRIAFFEAAERIFDKYGYRKTSIADICEEAGLSKPTFYGIFRNKADIFVQVQFYFFEVEIVEWQSRLDSDITPVERLKEFFSLYEKLVREKAVFRILGTDMSILKEFEGFFQNIEQSPAVTVLRDILAQGVETGHFRRLNPDNALWIIYSILDSMYVMLPSLMRRKGAMDDPELAREVKEFILNAVGVKKT